ncbi:MAG: hypothetical protein U0797_13865 [Gemmataceae bacterium]
MPPTRSPKYLILARRRWLVSELGELGEAEALARRSLAMAAADPDQRTGRSHAVFCHSHLCEIAWQRRDWGGLEESARLGEELNREVGHLLEQAEFSTWQALLARRAGREERARRHFHQTERRIARLGMPPDHIYFDAVCAYLEQGGELDQALAARDAVASSPTPVAGPARFAAGSNAALTGEGGAVSRAGEPGRRCARR